MDKIRSTYATIVQNEKVYVNAPSSPPKSTDLGDMIKLQEYSLRIV